MKSLIPERPEDYKLIDEKESMVTGPLLILVIIAFIAMALSTFHLLKCQERNAKYELHQQLNKTEMEKLKIRVQSLEDAKNGIPLIEGPEPGNTEETEDVTIGFLENGMASGKTSVMICLKMEDGTYKIGQISNGNFIGLMAAFRGAVSRFEDREL